MNSTLHRLPPTKPYHAVSKLALEREQAVQDSGREFGLEYVILRPASTIGARDHASFFSRMYVAHLANAFPMIGGGTALFSCVDARDVGRAMAWLSNLPGAAGETYLLRGFDLSWRRLKEVMDLYRGVVAKTRRIPRLLALPLATAQERLAKEPGLTRYAVDYLTRNRVWDDSKIRRTGFEPKYSLQAAVTMAMADLDARRLKNATKS